jgi:hypothetical protein
MDTIEYINFLENTITQQIEQLTQLKIDCAKAYVDGYNLRSKISEAQETPLTDDEIKNIARQVQSNIGVSENEHMSYDVLFNYARAIENAHGVV